MDLSPLLPLLHRTARVAALTGAGISAESGIPTFRGPEGYWKNHRPEELATPQAFQRDPRLVWEWYDMRRTRIAACAPNAGHATLARWEGRFADFAVITQNVDGLHQRAGSRRVIPIHGHIWEMRCTREETTILDYTTPLPNLPPHCPACGALYRPAVVWFGEALPMEALAECGRILDTCDVLLVIGTSGQVHPASTFPYTVLERGGAVIEINPTETPLSADATVSLRGPAAVVLPAIERELHREPS